MAAAVVGDDRLAELIGIACFSCAAFVPAVWHSPRSSASREDTLVFHPEFLIDALTELHPQNRLWFDPLNESHIFVAAGWEPSASTEIDSVGGWNMHSPANDRHALAADGFEFRPVIVPTIEAYG